MSLHSEAPESPRMPERPRMIEEEDRPGPPPLMSEEKSKGRGLTILAATLAVAAFAGIVWYAYDHGRLIGSETAAPLIQADATPTKVRPDLPGGMVVPHQDKLVLDDLGSGRGAQTGGSRVERLLPPPETPLPPPEPLSIPSTTDLAPLNNDPAATEETVKSAPVSPQNAASAPPVAAATATDDIAQAEKPVSAQPKTAESTALVPPPPAIPPVKKIAESNPTPAPKPVAPQAPAKSISVPTPAPVAAGGFNIQIAALRSKDAAAREWKRVKAANIALLGALEPIYQRAATSSGVFFRVRSGPLSKNAARDICAALKAKGQACLVLKR